MTLRLLKYIFLIWIFLLVLGCDRDEPSLHKINIFEIEEEKKTSGVDLPDLNGESFTSILKDIEIFDDINGRTWSYNVILPPDYEPETEKKYPVLYLLHGRGATKDSWVNSFKIQSIADYYIKSGYPDLVIVMPQADSTYYVDNYQGNIKYETFFINRFIPEIEKKFSIVESKDKRIIAGFSMGGYGAAYYSLKYNDLFSYCGAFSAPLKGKDDPSVPSVLKNATGKNPEDLPFLLLEVGNEDSFAEVNIEAHVAFLLWGIQHELILRPGGHNSKFWQESCFSFFEKIKPLLE